jgi:hypothetical protein
MAPLPPLLPVLVSLLATPALAIPYGIQTTDSRSSYAGSFQYDADNDVVYMTGATYGSFWNNVFGDEATSTTSDCYFGILQLPSDRGDAILPPSWLFKSKIGVTNVVETCGPLAVQGSKAYLGGWSEPNGLLNGLLASGSIRSEQYGFILDVDVSLQTLGAASPTTTDVRGGKLVHNTNGPQSTVSLVLSELADALYMASLESDDTSTLLANTSDQPNYSTGGVLKRGSDFYITIMKLAPTTGGDGTTETLKRSWEREIATLEGIGNVAGMLLFSDTILVLAGSAVGSDDAIPNNGKVGSDSDGFVSFFSPDDGRITGAMRIQSQVDRDDYIYDVCMNPGDEFIYVVGSTKGSFTTALNVQEVTEAFLIKIHPATQAVVWTQPLTAQLGTQPASIEGLACAVTPDGLHVYLGGVVKDSATIDTHVTEGGDDFAFAQYNADTGNLVWTQQFGTRGNEHLSDLATDKEGHLLIFGTTDGSYFRERVEGGFTDVVILGLARSNGAGPVNIDLGNPRPPSDLITNPTQPPVAPTPNSQPAPTPAPTIATLDLAATPAPAAKKGKRGIVVMAWLFAASVVVVVFLVWRRRRNRESYPDSAQVLEYLRGFDDVEVDLKHSATGGYHGTYVNHDGGPRYYKGDSETVSFGNEMSPLTYDPIVEQSLFSIDDDDPPSFGGGGGGGSLQRQASNYDGLMDAYNTAWGDLSQHTLPSHPEYSPADSSRMTSSRGSRSARAILEDDVFQEVDIRGDKSKSPSTKIAKSKARSMRWGNEII